VRDDLANEPPAIDYEPAEPDGCADARAIPSAEGFDGSNT
jgi:hypothetical protein